MKSNRPPRKIAPDLDVIPFPVNAGQFGVTPCPNCAASLSIHQPDPQLPDRLIGTCGACRHWFLIDILPDQAEGLMVRLPDHQVIRALSRQNPSEGISLVGTEGGGNAAGAPGPDA